MEKSAKRERIESQVDRFLENLSKLDAGGLVQLLRSAGKRLEEAHSVPWVFFRVLPFSVQSKREQNIYFLVATLYPLTEITDVGNFGDTMKMIRMTMEVKPEERGGINRRMELLLDADEDELPYRLYHMIQFAKVKGAPINGKGLILDLMYWNYPERRVQLAWARIYFSD